MVQKPEVFEKLVALRPQLVSLWFARANVLASRSQWPQAAEHYAQTLQLGDKFAKLSDEEKLRQHSQFLGYKLTENELKLRLERTSPGLRQYALYHLALVRLLAGDEKGYQEACDRIDREADSVVDPLFAQVLSRALSVSDAETIDRSAAIRLAERSVAADPKVAWYWYALGA